MAQPIATNTLSPHLPQKKAGRLIAQRQLHVLQCRSHGRDERRVGALSLRLFAAPEKHTRNEGPCFIIIISSSSTLIITIIIGYYWLLLLLLLLLESCLVCLLFSPYFRAFPEGGLSNVWPLFRFFGGWLFLLMRWAGNENWNEPEGDSRI